MERERSVMGLHFFQKMRTQCEGYLTVSVCTTWSRRSGRVEHVCMDGRWSVWHAASRVWMACACGPVLPSDFSMCPAAAGCAWYLQ